MIASLGKHDFRTHPAVRRAASTVSAAYAETLVAFAAARGAERDVLLARAGLTARALAEPDARLPFAAYEALMREAASLCGDPAFALRLGADQAFDKVSVVGLLCYASASMGDAVISLNRYGALVAQLDMPLPGRRFQLTRTGRGLWLTDTWTGALAFPELTEETWSRFIADTTRAFPDEPFVFEVHVPHPRPAHAASYEALWKVPVVFGSDRNAMLIADTWPDIPLSPPDRYVFGVLSAHAAKLLEGLQAQRSVQAQLEAALLPSLHREGLRMDAVAQGMGLSRQSLARRLKAEGTTYALVLDALRRRMALNYLDGGEATVNETAALLGFSEASAFSRAFKRWTGVSPRNHRA